MKPFEMRIANVICPSCGKKFLRVDTVEIMEKGFRCDSCGHRIDPGPTMQEKLIVASLQQKNLVEAVKIHRAFTGLGLKESKEAVEAIAQKYQIEIKKGCFIATACYGSDRETEVVLFQQYRDLVLQKHLMGRWMIRAYYRLSLPIAHAIQSSEKTKAFIRKTILSPLARKLEKKNWNRRV